MNGDYKEQTAFGKPGAMRMRYIMYVYVDWNGVQSDAILEVLDPFRAAGLPRKSTLQHQFLPSVFQVEAACGNFILTLLDSL